MNKKFLTVMLCILIALVAVIPINMSVNASENENESESQNQIEDLSLNRNVSLDEDGDYKVKLEAYVNGTIKSVPSDIVILVNETKRMDTKDVIGSVQYNEFRDNNFFAYNKFNLYAFDNNKYYKINIIKRRRNCHNYYYYSYTNDNGEELTYGSRADSGRVPGELELYEKSIESKTRLDYSKDIVKNLVNDIKQDAENNNISHRVAVSGFSDSTNTGVYTTSTGTKKHYNNLTPTDYENSMIDVNKNYNNVEDAISNIESVDTEITRSDTATEIANNILNNSNVNRNKVVIMISDYNYDTKDESEENEIISKSIELANSMKSKNKVKFLSVGINNDTSKNNDKQNELLKYLSSNYSNAKSIDNTGEKTSDKFYISFDDSNKLVTMSKTIKIEKPTANINLNNTAKVKDNITNQFNINEESVKTYTLDYSGNNSWSNKKNIKTDIKMTKNSCNINGFDFDKNCVVSEDNKDYGKKLVVEYTLKPKSDYLGGNEVDTNKETSGIYVNNELIKKSPQNNVDVPIKNVEIETQDINTYITQSIDIKNIIKNNSNIEINGTNNKNVKIEYKIKNKDIDADYNIEPGATKGTWNIKNEKSLIKPVDSQKANVQCRVYPKKTGLAKEKITKDAININVFKPKLKINNSKVNPDQNVNLLSNINVEWLCDNKDVNELPLGSPPELILEFSNNKGIELQNQNKIRANENVMFQVSSVKINNIDILNDTFFNPSNLIAIEVYKKENDKDKIEIKPIQKPIIKQISKMPEDTRIPIDNKLDNKNVLIKQQDGVVVEEQGNSQCNYIKNYNKKEVKKDKIKSSIENISNADSASGKKLQSTTKISVKKKQSVLSVLMSIGITVVIISVFKLIKKPKKI